MRRVLVPLDGSRLAEAVLPDALRLAGPDGELILIRDAGWTHVDASLEEYGEWHAVEETELYLANMAQHVEEEGVRATAYRLTASDVSAAIDDAASFLKVDMVACATHGRGPLGRLMFGGIVWKALAESRRPILLFHPEANISERPDAEEEQGTCQEIHNSASSMLHAVRPPEGARRKILVPLDGSPFAEAAIPMARQLAAEWKALLYLARVVPDPSIPSSLFGGEDEAQAEVNDAQTYLSSISKPLDMDIDIEVLSGDPADQLVAAVDNWGITDVVMSSHGLTGLKRAFLGSVADELIHRVHRPAIVVPPLAMESRSHGEEPMPQGVRVT